MAPTLGSFDHPASADPSADPTHEQGNPTYVKLCIEHGIALKSNEEPKIQPGWEQKPKGMLQLLWELGSINSTNVKQYTIDGTKDM